MSDHLLVSQREDDQYIEKLKTERDALARRVAELEAALKNFTRDGFAMGECFCSDHWKGRDIGGHSPECLQARAALASSGGTGAATRDEGATENDGDERGQAVAAEDSFDNQTGQQSAHATGGGRSPSPTVALPSREQAAYYAGAYDKTVVAIERPIEPRRIVQITGSEVLFALASDGTLWKRYGSMSNVGYWEPVQPLPDESGPTGDSNDRPF